jgi:hypothetical protein
MDKAKYRKAGIALLSIWIIVWVVLICLSLPHTEGFKNLMANMVVIALINFTFNPCLLTGAILLDLNAKTPLRKPILIRFTVFYLILCIPVFVFIFMPMDRPINYGGGLRVIEKPVAGERK